MPILASGLFFLLLLELVQSQTKSKGITVLISLLMIALILLSLIASASYITNHMDEMLNINTTDYSGLLSKIGFKLPDTLDSTFVITTVVSYIKRNISILTSVGTNLAQILIGIIFGISFFLYKKSDKPVNTNWDLFIDAISFYLSHYYKSFKIVMKTQILVSLMNVISLTILALVIAPISTGSVMPYWYLLLPIAFVLSLIPVLGNIMVNIVIFIIAINISFIFTVISIIYFFFMNKMEIVVIGKFLGKKVDIPFIFIAIGMFIGELVFNSLLGVLFGTVTLLATKIIMDEFKVNLNKP
jgi:predicted PurR-regulated permease PerM